MVVAAGTALGVCKLWVALVYSWNDDFQQFDPFIDADGNAALAWANLADFWSPYGTKYLQS